MTKVNLSTGGFPNYTGLEISKKLISDGIKNIELSGGKFDKNIITNINKLKGKANFSIHNYFPPPQKGFVLNLASLNDLIFERSIEHAKNAIKICELIDSNVYSLHAGFRIDPCIDEIGKKISNKRRIVPYKDSLNRFYEALNILSIFCSNKNIDLYIENNVFSQANKKSFGENPFLLSDDYEFDEFLTNKPNNVKLLMDVAHLKVSANSIGFNSKKTLLNLEKHISAYHLSENDGIADTNNEINKKSWFWDYISFTADFYTIEVYRKDINILKDQVNLTESIINKIK